uniref:SET domain-containing protein n=1 Tax=Alexandrium monilatum TaxID=311494 RepID=A0A7S4SLY9_9DINO
MARPAARGAAAFKSGDYAAAADAYSEALAEANNAEDRAAALANRAQCRLRLGRVLEAREDAAAARALAPASPKAWYRLGVCEARLARLPEAGAALEEAARLRPGDRDVAEALAAVRRRRSEASGKYAWTEVYQRYLAPADAAPPRAACPAAACDPSCGVLAALGVEPFVGPVRLDFSEGRGRGLFATRDVRAGQLLMCAQAVVTGDNDKLPELLADSLERSAELQAAVLALSRGTPASEASLPLLDLQQLAAPRRCGGGEGGGAADAAARPPSEALSSVLYFNQFSLPRVNPNAAPIEVTNDPGRSGLWLLPSFVNHSCRPNVQRVMVRDCLFLRAARDLGEGDELLDCYIESLQPRARRAASLASYGIGDCGCERCLLEAAVLDAAQVQEVVEQAGRTKEDPEDDAPTAAAKAEAAATRAEAVIAHSLERSLTEGRVPRLRCLPLPEATVTAQRMAVLREGIERFADAQEEESFRRQEHLHRLLLSSLANVVRSHAMSLRGLGRYVEQSAAWSRVLDALEAAIPCSELAAAVGAEALSSKLLAFNLDFRRAGRGEFRRALLQTHRAYGGGAPVWRALNKQGFAASVLEGAQEVWAGLEQELRDSADDSCGPAGDSADDSCGLAALPEAAQPAKSQAGFEDLLRRRAREERRAEEVGEAGAGSQRPQSLSGAAHGGAGESAASRGTRLHAAALTDAGPACPQSGDVEGGGAAAPDAASGAPDLHGAAASYQVQLSGPEEIVVVASLPGLASGADASLQVSGLELCLRSMRSDRPHALVVPLPGPVDPTSASARWSKRTQRLTVRLRRAASEGPGA